MIFISPPCATFSRATWANYQGPRPVRSFASPRGLETLTAKERDRAILGNIFADFSWEVAGLVVLGKARFLAFEQPEDLGALTSGPRRGQRPATMWLWPQHGLLRQRGLRSVAFYQSEFGAKRAKPTRLLLATHMPMPEFVFEGEPTYDVNGYYTGPLPAPSAIPTQSRLLAPKLPDAWPARMCEWLAQLALATWAPPAATEPAAKGEIAQQPARESPLASPSRTDPSATTTSPTSRRAPGYRVAAGGPGYATKWMDLVTSMMEEGYMLTGTMG